MSNATLPPRSQYFMKPFSPEEWDEIFAPLREGMEEIHGILQSKTYTSKSLPPKSLEQPSVNGVQDSQPDNELPISETSPHFNAQGRTPCPSVPDPLPLFFKEEVEVSEHPLRLLDNPIDTTLAVLSSVTVPPKCSFPSGTLDNAPHPNAFSNEIGEGNHNGMLIFHQIIV